MVVANVLEELVVVEGALRMALEEGTVVEDAQVERAVEVDAAVGVVVLLFGGLTRT